MVGIAKLTHATCNNQSAIVILYRIEKMKSLGLLGHTRWNEYGLKALFVSFSHL